MAKTFSLQPLLNLAEQQNEAAIRKLGQMNQQMQSAQAKLDTLMQYRKDYQVRLQSEVKNGINLADLRNFQDFIQRLDDAITQQQKSNEVARNALNMARNELQEAQRKMKSFATLAHRHVENEKKLTEKIEQRQQDEHTGRISTVRAAAAQNE